MIHFFAESILIGKGFNSLGPATKISKRQLFPAINATTFFSVLPIYLKIYVHTWIQLRLVFRKQDELLNRDISHIQSIFIYRLEGNSRTSALQKEEEKIGKPLQPRSVNASSLIHSSLNSMGPAVPTNSLCHFGGAEENI